MIVETGMSVTINVVVTDHQAENVASSTEIRGVVGVKIDMVTEIDVTVVAIVEIVGITITKSKTDHAVPRGGLLVALFEADWRENETIGIKDPDRSLGIAETEINIK